ncbi:MAG: alpha/beta fold hydrolase [Burkholderiaceae bacterium]
MSNNIVFVLVHGAWHGAWCWQRVQPLLTQAGVANHAVCLTGVGERAHCLSAGIRLATHVQDVVSTVVANEWQRVVLVGHSYAGMVITQAAYDLTTLMPNVVQSLIYLDAHVPYNGESWASLQDPQVMALRIKKARTAGGGVFYRHQMPACLACLGLIESGLTAAKHRNRLACTKTKLIYKTRSWRPCQKPTLTASVRPCHRYR